ncbi:LexA family protein [Flavobacterium silvaticum]|uniref:Translesion error-prone DNA polymerase V autoproteolytic subunit n=1 Tax=Flavobacterium silvaticum TaxID=1852020 RepID=A0A972JIA9_9FLAO|nr:translesion error-prone DNA polymerase V autoproteolytic subunit [Flavobacterium silvaticum]NMH28815.1 translesion error-prone DNA polymerase V autoproteolytic subunit [Flavobacterium silvaticum]
MDIPFFPDGVSAGFPSPADDYCEQTISLDTEVFGNAPFTKFCVRVTGTSMKDAGIDHGDIVVVDKGIEPADHDIAVCVLNGEFTLKRLKVEKDSLWLLPENNQFKPIPIPKDADFEVWGIVTHTLKYHRKRK